MPLLCLVLLFSLTSVAATTGHAQRRGLPPPETIDLTADVAVPMEMAGGRPLVSVFVNGRGPFLMILDSGATGSVLSDRLAKELGLPAQGEVVMDRPGGKTKGSGTLTRVDEVRIGALVLSGVIAVSTDLSALQERLQRRDVVGVLSATMLDGVLVTYDYPGSRLAFRRGELPAANGATIFDWAAEERLLSVPITVDGRKHAMMIDTGSASGFVFPEDVAKDFAWQEEPKLGEPFRVLDGTMNARDGRLKGEVKLGAESYRDPAIRVVEGPIQLIGYKVLKDYRLVIDATHRRFELIRR